MLTDADGCGRIRWAKIAHELDLSHVKWVFPQANCRAVTMRAGISA
jgi:hypothetical protein